MKILLISIICLIAICVLMYYYYGGFKSLKVEIATQGGELIIYDSIIGDYSQSGVVMDKIYYSLLNDYQIETYKGYGKYFDNPQKVEKSKLRSEAGCVIELKDVFKAKNANVYKSKILPEQKYIISEFPYKGKLSVLFSLMKVYPALVKFAKQNGYDEDAAVIEIYDIPNKKIFYRKEILKK